MLSPRALVRGNPARAKFAAKNCNQVIRSDNVGFNLNGPSCYFVSLDMFGFGKDY